MFKKVLFLQAQKAGIAQLVEHDLAKVGVADSSSVSRSTLRRQRVIAAFLYLLRPPELAQRRAARNTKIATPWLLSVESYPSGEKDPARRRRANSARRVGFTD